MIGYTEEQVQSRQDLEDMARENRRALLSKDPEDWQTWQVLASQYQENTGRHFLDSGGAYGRNWERAQMRIYGENGAPNPTMLSWRYGLETSIDAYSYCLSMLEYDAKADQAFQTYADLYPDQYWSETVENWLEWIQSAECFDVGEYPDAMICWATRDDQQDWIQDIMRRVQDGDPCYDEMQSVLAEYIYQLPRTVDHGVISGIYGEGDYVSENTYNGECALSQTLQYWYFTAQDCAVLDDGVYLVLQTHNGCDVRGGYSQPRVYMLDYHDGEAWFFYNDLQIVPCPPDDVIAAYNAQLSLDGIAPSSLTRGVSWYTDDGYHWYADHGHRATQLQDYDVVHVDDLGDYNADHGTDWAIGDPDTGIVIVSDDDIGYCPITGYPLRAYSRADY